MIAAAFFEAPSCAAVRSLPVNVTPRESCAVSGAALMDSGWGGRRDIRVNVDKRNLDGSLALRADLLHRFEGTKLSVYPGHVDVLGDQAYDGCSCLATDEWASFALELARQHWVFTRGGLHPADGADGTCVATRRQGFVVGPEGELYKCWDNVGRPSMVVGSIHAGETITDPAVEGPVKDGPASTPGDGKVAVPTNDAHLGVRGAAAGDQEPRERSANAGKSGYSEHPPGRRCSDSP